MTLILPDVEHLETLDDDEIVGKVRLMGRCPWKRVRFRKQILANGRVSYRSTHPVRFGPWYPKRRFSHIQVTLRNIHGTGTIPAKRYREFQIGTIDFLVGTW